MISKTGNFSQFFLLFFYSSCHSRLRICMWNAKFQFPSDAAFRCFNNGRIEKCLKSNDDCVTWLALHVKSEKHFILVTLHNGDIKSLRIRSLYRRLKKSNENGIETTKENNMTNEVKSNDTHVENGTIFDCLQRVESFLFLFFFILFSYFDSHFPCWINERTCSVANDQW